MGKRRLTDQQQRRIASQQQRRNAHSSTDQDEYSGELSEGLVVTRYSRQAAVLPHDFAVDDSPFRCHIRANITDLVTGDRVMWRPGKPTGIIESVLPRTSLMSRPDNRGVLRPMAANVDQIAVVFAPQPEPHQNLIDRYLVAIEHLTIRPLLLFNKVDMLSEDNAILRDLLRIYEELEYQVVRVSATSGLGMDTLLQAMRGHTTVLVGQSGAGKSSLINRIHPAADAATGDLSQVAKGRHTTTATRYYALPEGGNLIDSPGIREFGLWHLQREEVARGFIEFRPYLGTCRFRDCSHGNEPDCAVIEAVEAGKIRMQRLLSYRQIIGEALEPRF